jgi:hypothetical protein
MSIRIALPLLLLLALAAAALGDERKPQPAAQAAGRSAFEAFKKLSGEWVTKAPEGSGEGGEVHVTYRVTSGGSAVVETVMPGTDHEMITVIHQDGDGVILTHYCMLGNQPQMRAAGQMEGNKVAFKFVHATNLASDKAPYMHHVAYTFVDDKTLKSDWTLYAGGKPSEHETFELKRKG